MKSNTYFQNKVQGRNHSKLGGGAKTIITQDRFEILHKVSNFQTPMQRHHQHMAANDIQINDKLLKKTSGYSVASKTNMPLTNRHQHNAHWEGTFTVSNLTP